MKSPLRCLFVLFLCQYAYADPAGDTKQAKIVFWAMFNDEILSHPYRWVLVGNRIIRNS